MKHSTLMMGVLVALLATAPAAHATDYVVTNTSDSALGSPTVPGSLRDSLERGRAGDTIVFDPDVFDLTNSSAATTIFIDSSLPYLDDGDLILDASDRRVTINGSGAGSANGLTISSSGNVVRGLTIVAFSGSGIQITGGSNNVIGGNPSIGGGPNGQGLRIAGNGTFGINITGPNATGNVIKGCWIGLDAGGMNAEANLGGVLMNGGAASNTIGSVVPGEENVISGNTGAGMTISDPGTDGNVIVGNIVGASAVSTTTSSRRELPNGGPGISIVDGAQLTQIGGTNAGEGNVIANNGGNGVEVRATNSKLNSARSNSITHNAGGGIALFDGSNDGIQPPKIQKIVQAPPSGTGLKLAVEGTTTSSGTVEIFNDTSSQGGTFLGRGTVDATGSFHTEIDGQAAGYLNVTATLTDDSGNTSQFDIFLPGLGDTDSDGFPDELEALAGTDPNDRLAQPLLAGVLTPNKVAVKLNFAKPSSDAINLKATLVLPPGYLLPGASFGVMVAGHGDELVLDPKGKAKSPDGLVSIAAKTSSKTGVTTVQYKMKKGVLGAQVGSFGLDNRTTDKAGEAVVLPVAVTTRSAIGGSVYSGVAAVTYKAKQGKSGATKDRK